MGYNNNNAGMHVIRHTAKNYYDDLEYYDRLAEEQFEQELEKKRAEEKKKKEKKKKKNHNAQQSMKIKKPIEHKYFNCDIEWYENIYLISVERKLDIYNALCECEKLCSEDSRMTDNINPLYRLTSLEKVNVFLNLLADKMGCNVCDFISFNAEKRRKRLYKILDDLHTSVFDCYLAPIFDYDTTEDDDEDADDIVEIISIIPDTYLALERLDCMMEYSFVKITPKTSDEEPVFVFCVSAGERYDTPVKVVNEISKFKYMRPGSEVAREHEGKIADFFEELSEYI